MDATPEPSEKEEESSDEEDDGFGAKKKDVEEDPVARNILKAHSKIEDPYYCQNSHFSKVNQNCFYPCKNIPNMYI